MPDGDCHTDAHMWTERGKPVSTFGLEPARVWAFHSAHSSLDGFVSHENCEQVTLQGPGDVGVAETSAPQTAHSTDLACTALHVRIRSLGVGPASRNQCETRVSPRLIQAGTQQSTTHRAGRDQQNCDSVQGWQVHCHCTRSASNFCVYFHQRVHL
jgi:hypothetical protein